MSEGAPCSGLNSATPTVVCRIQLLSLATMLVTAALLAISLCSVTALFIWRRHHFNYFKQLGIPGPEPNLIWGNLVEYHSTESYKVIGKWIEKYGNVFGFFNGDAPFVVLNDLDFIEYVYVRNFQNFVDRGFNMMTDQMHPVLGKSLLLIGGPEWKDIRSTVAYSMSAAKLKMIMPHLEENADVFIRTLEKYADTDREVHMLPEFEQLSMDYTARGVFGIDEHFQGNLDHPLFNTARGVFRGIMKGPLHMIARLYKQRQVSSAAIASSAISIFLGGFESTSTSLSYIVFNLAKYPDVQEKARDEVLEALSTSGTLDYDTTMRKLKYLGQVVDETLRLYPPGLLFVTRKAKEDFEYHGVKFKAGTAFMVSQYHLHRNSQCWTDPDEFYPDRFARENEALLRKVAHAPFGIGPRNCVGSRLAMLSLKYTLARMLQKYRLELGPSQMGSMVMDTYSFASIPARGPWIKLYRV
ncbi:cytochrome P450 3A14 isoform X2 [Rhipicephalus microplus]|uniref:cytochrome P450 3A14 isoform X2 n=1 Tax=Rhipicephalus microplus TaxID=6941 RepID=UPI003F6D7331